MHNKLGHYIWRRIQKDNTNPKFIKMKPRDMMSGLFLGPSDIQRYVNDYFEYGVDHMGDDECADDRIERYWDDPDGVEI